MSLLIEIVICVHSHSCVLILSLSVATLENLYETNKAPLIKVGNIISATYAVVREHIKTVPSCLFFLLVQLQLLASPKKGMLRQPAMKEKIKNWFGYFLAANKKVNNSKGDTADASLPKASCSFEMARIEKHVSGNNNPEEQIDKIRKKTHLYTAVSNKVVICKRQKSMSSILIYGFAG